MPAKKILTFSSSEVKALIETAKAATEFRHTFGETYNPALHFGGKVKNNEHGYPDPDNIDKSKLKPMLWLVKDEGVYLMGNGVETDHVPGTKLPVVYANECNPKDEDCYDNSRYIMGGDDGCDALPLDGFEAALASNKPTIQIRVTAKNLEII